MKTVNQSVNQNEVEAVGEVGAVYTTNTGLEVADLDRDVYGWRQFSQSRREKVESTNLAIHGPTLLSWQRV